LVPFGLIALSRAGPSPARPVHLVLDMDKQPKFKGQRANLMFADGRAMRPRVPGTVARDDLLSAADAAGYDRVQFGVERQADGKLGYVTRIPLPVSMALMRRGQERFNIYCSACHGRSGYGDGMVARRAAELQAAGSNDATGWVVPANYHTDEVRGRPLGNLYSTVTNGVRSMPALGTQIPVADRWAIVAYLKALQRGQHARPEDVPEDQRAVFAE
jgi:mono/diheme cytochrome c family protein